MNSLKLGKKAARPGAIKFKLSNYLDLSALPVPPRNFGHENLIEDWGVLANDRAGCCVLSGGGHETMLWNTEAGCTVPFNDEATLADYSAITGYNPSAPNSDQGTDMQVAAEYRRTTGIVDANGKRHKIVAYVSIQPGNTRELYSAMYLFQAVGVGIRFPASAMDQFNAEEPWAVEDPNSPIEGGHYIPCFSHRHGYILCVTWGKIQALTPAFFRHYCDEAVVYLTEEDLVAGKTLDGFDFGLLQQDLAKLKTS